MESSDKEELLYQQMVKDIQRPSESQDENVSDSKKEEQEERGKLGNQNENIDKITIQGSNDDTICESDPPLCDPPSQGKLEETENECDLNLKKELASIIKKLDDDSETKIDKVKENKNILRITKETLENNEVESGISDKEEADKLRQGGDNTNTDEIEEPTSPVIGFRKSSGRYIPISPVESPFHAKLTSPTKSPEFGVKRKLKVHVFHSEKRENFSEQEISKEKEEGEISMKDKEVSNITKQAISGENCQDLKADGTEPVNSGREILTSVVDGRCLTGKTEGNPSLQSSDNTEIFAGNDEKNPVSEGCKLDSSVISNEEKARCSSENKGNRYGTADEGTKGSIVAAGSESVYVFSESSVESEDSLTGADERKDIQDDIYNDKSLDSGNSSDTDDSMKLILDDDDSLNNTPVKHKPSDSESSSVTKYNNSTDEFTRGDSQLNKEINDATDSNSSGYERKPVERNVSSPNSKISSSSHENQVVDDMSSPCVDVPDKKRLGLCASENELKTIKENDSSKDLEAEKDEGEELIEGKDSTRNLEAYQEKESAIEGKCYIEDQASENTKKEKVKGNDSHKDLEAEEEEIVEGKISSQHIEGKQEQEYPKVDKYLKSKSENKKEETVKGSYSQDLEAEHKRKDKELQAEQKKEDEDLQAEQKEKDEDLKSQQKKKDKDLEAEQRTENEDLESEQKKENKDLESEQKKEDKDLEAEQKKEDKDLQAEHKQEDKDLEVEQKKKDKDLESQQNKEDKDLESQPYKEDKDLESEQKKGDKDLEADQKKDDGLEVEPKKGDGLESEQKEDKDLECEQKKEKRDLEVEQEKGDKDLEVEQKEKDKDLDGKVSKEPEELGGFSGKDRSGEEKQTQEREISPKSLNVEQKQPSDIKARKENRDQCEVGDKEETGIDEKTERKSCDLTKEKGKAPVLHTKKTEEKKLDRLNDIQIHNDESIVNKQGRSDEIRINPKEGKISSVTNIEKPVSLETEKAHLSDVNSKNSEVVRQKSKFRDNESDEMCPASKVARTSNVPQKSDDLDKDTLGASKISESGSISKKSSEDSEKDVIASVEIPHKRTEIECVYLSGEEDEQPTTSKRKRAVDMVCKKCRDVWSDDILLIIFKGTESVTVNSKITYGAIVCISDWINRNLRKSKKEAMTSIFDRADLGKNIAKLNIDHLDLWLDHLLQSKKNKCCDVFTAVYGSDKDTVGADNIKQTSATNVPKIPCGPKNIMPTLGKDCKLVSEGGRMYLVSSSPLGADTIKGMKAQIQPSRIVIKNPGSVPQALTSNSGQIRYTVPTSVASSAPSKAPMTISKPLFVEALPHSVFTADTPSFSSAQMSQSKSSAYSNKDSSNNNLDTSVVSVEKNSEMKKKVSISEDHQNQQKSDTKHSSQDETELQGMLNHLNLDLQQCHIYSSYCAKPITNQMKSECPTEEDRTSTCYFNMVKERSVLHSFARVTFDIMLYEPNNLECLSSACTRSVRNRYVTKRELLTLQSIFILNPEKPDINLFYKVFIQILISRRKTLLLPDSRSLLVVTENIRKKYNREKSKSLSIKILDENWDPFSIYSAQEVWLTKADLEEVTNRDIISLFCTWRSLDTPFDGKLSEAVSLICKSHGLKNFDSFGSCIKLYTNFCRYLFEDNVDLAKAFLDEPFSGTDYIISRNCLAQMVNNKKRKLAWDFEVEDDLHEAMKKYEALENVALEELTFPILKDLCSSLTEIQEKLEAYSSANEEMNKRLKQLVSKRDTLMQVFQTSHVKWLTSMRAQIKAAHQNFVARHQKEVDSKRRIKKQKSSSEAGPVSKDGGKVAPHIQELIKDLLLKGVKPEKVLNVINSVSNNAQRKIQLELPSEKWIQDFAKNFVT